MLEFENIWISSTSLACCQWWMPATWDPHDHEVVPDHKRCSHILTIGTETIATAQKINRKYFLSLAFDHLLFNRGLAGACQPRAGPGRANRGLITCCWQSFDQQEGKVVSKGLQKYSPKVDWLVASDECQPLGILMITKWCIQPWEMAFSRYRL